ncbi:MAG: aminotransferase class V-fold PLP-dependent enzyme, partial [Wenzhouxiangellaceae bacterium]|nr:aminotransferase class V-fold PLP-dependent enzyme [Wenzhouxiangellaceae bacterium]
LVAVSSVRYDTGTRLDLERIGRACRNHGALLAVDAIQHLGAVPLDVSALPVDFVVAGSHKWLLAPEGLAVFWSSPAARARLRPTQAGWRMWPDMFDFARCDWSIPDSARRFEPGTLNTAGIQALLASVSLLLELGELERADALERNVDRLADGLASIDGVRVVTPLDPARRAGIVTFEAEGLEPAKTVRALRERDVFCADRGHGIRLSPHCYTPPGQLDRALEAIADLLGRS